MALVLSPQLKTALGLCLSVRGGIGGLHYRRSPGGRHIVYRERVPTTALTDKQQAHRVKFLRAYEQWNSLSDDQKANWELAARRFSTRQIGSHLFVREWWHQRTELQAQALLWLNITLVLPGP